MALDGGFIVFTVLDAAKAVSSDTDTQRSKSAVFHSGKVHCSESILPLVAIALQLSAFRGERIYSSQLTVNPLAMLSAGNNSSL